MIPVTQLRVGRAFQEEGEPFLVLKYTHTKLGRGKANIKVRVKNLRTGAILSKTFISDNKVEEIITRKRRLSYLYKDSKHFHFMDQKSFEQFEIKAQVLGEKKKFLKSGLLVDVFFWSPGEAREFEPLALELPPKIAFEVVETSPGVKGNSATNVYKDAVLENGLRVKVPLFIGKGEEVIIDTRTCEYVEKAKKS